MAVRACGTDSVMISPVCARGEPATAAPFSGGVSGLPGAGMGTATIGSDA